MGGINRPILFAALFIGLTGAAKSLLTKGKYSRALIGTYVFILLLSLVDLIGGQVSRFASAFALLAALYAFLTQMPWGAIASVFGRPQAQTSQAQQSKGA